MAVRHKTSYRYDANWGRNTMGIKSVTAKTPAKFAGAFPALPRGDDPLSQILTQRPHNFPFMKGK